MQPHPFKLNKQATFSWKVFLSSTSLKKKNIRFFCFSQIVIVTYFASLVVWQWPRVMSSARERMWLANPVLISWEFKHLRSIDFRARKCRNFINMWVFYKSEINSCQCLAYGPLHYTGDSQFVSRKFNFTNKRLSSFVLPQLSKEEFMRGINFWNNLIKSNWRKQNVEYLAFRLHVFYISTPGYLLMITIIHVHVSEIKIY